MSTTRAASSAVRVAGAKGAVLALFVSAAALLAITSVAYACTGKASLYDVRPSSGEPGTTVTVKGENYHDGEVEIRWDDAEGQLLGTARGPSFTKQVTIPEAAAGNYAMVGIAYDPLTGEEEGRDAKPFRVLSSDDPANDSSDGSGNPSDGSTSQSSTSGDPSQDTTSDDSTSQEPSSQDSTSQEPSSQDSTSQEPSSQDSTSQEPSSQDSTSQQPSSHDATSQEPSSQDSTSPEPSSNGARENTDARPSEQREQPTQSNQGATPSDQGSSDQAAVTEAAAQDDDAAAPETAGDPELESEGQGGLATTPEARRPQPRSSQSSDFSDETTKPSSRTGSQDLWGGLDSGEGPGRAPSLDEPSAEGELAGAGQHLAVAAGLLGAGLVLLMGGVLVAAMRRRTLATAEREERPRR